MRARVNKAMEEMRRSPFQGPNVVKLTGPLRGLYRYRVGRFRIVYEVEEQRRVVVVRGILARRRA
jgi:mRNA interferase RelE/StbE